MTLVMLWLRPPQLRLGDLCHSVAHWLTTFHFPHNVVFCCDITSEWGLFLSRNFSPFRSLRRTDDERTDSVALALSPSPP